MGFGAPWHWIVVLIVVLLLFGKGRVADIMGDFGKGIKSFKQGLSDAEKAESQPPAQIPSQAPADGASPTASAADTTKTGQ